MIEDKFNLADEFYWSDPWSTRKDIQRPMMLGGIEGFLIGTPKTVPLNEKKNFPMALLRVKKVVEDDNTIDFNRSAIVTAIDLATSKLSAKLVFEQAEEKTAKTASTGSDVTAMSSEAQSIDLASQLDLPSNAADYIINVICLDQSSNRCRMNVVDSASYQDPEVAAFLRAHRMKTMDPPEVNPSPIEGEEIPGFEKLESSPVLPTETGINLSVTRVTAIDPESECIIQGSYRLPAQAHQIMANLEEDKKKDDAPVAIIPITLLVTGSVDTDPVLLELQVACNTPLEKQGEASIASGYFALDLCKQSDLNIAAQTYFIYAFSAEVMTAAKPAAFVKIPELEQA